MSKTRQIIETYIRDTHPKSVQKKFAAWLKDARNKKEKDEILLEIWDKTNAEADRSTEESFRKVQSKIALRRKARHFSIFYRLLKIAAVVLPPLLSVAVTYLYLKENIEDVKPVEYMVPNGEIRSLTLPDSSEVRLNSGSILIYPQHFGKTRNVYLSGEAYFSVVHNDKHPFIVTTTDWEVEVLGTVFNISSYMDSESSSATLEQGKISVRLKNPGNAPVILTANEQAVYNRNSGLLEKHTVQVDRFTAWTKGSILIQGMSIDEIAKIIERKYAMKVYFNMNRYKDEKITMKFRDEENITEFMNVLHYLVPGLRYKIANDELYIY
ncbi:MAG: FecR domain-containing protein [Tannerella sp.]|jgi:ferric-dicitrate binding protein FerR (iron transport regulator)|nr:FecR domain-containing protein [Tannerella sp.]